MKREELIRKFKELARHNEKLRRDTRYKNVLGFFTHWGFLNASKEYPNVGNLKIPLRDAIWVGQKVEPRILEVLPAAFARLPKRFDYLPKELVVLEKVVRDLRNDVAQGHDFLGVPYEKLKTWYNLPLLDKRTKTPNQKKVARNFRLRPEVLNKLEILARKKNMNVTELIEQMVLES